MYCLVVSGDEEAWKKPSGHHDFDYSRTAQEYTVNALRDQFKDKLDGLTELPCIFSNEHGTKQPAQFGWITKVERRQQIVRIYYEIQKDFPTVTMAQLKELEWQLDIGNLEMYRAHLAVKEVDLLAVLVEAKIVKPEQAKTGKAGQVPPQKAPPTLHISPQVFRIPDTAPDPNLVSVMMPFGAPFNPVYKTLQAACEEAGLKCERVDNIWEETACQCCNRPSSSDSRHFRKRPRSSAILSASRPLQRHGTLLRGHVAPLRSTVFLVWLWIASLRSQ